jgi:NAD(P)-dependent dehydrogenase (short-subunit alcohol dehydrogenase family)
MSVLLITGAGRGIGASTARLAAGRGYDVAINYKSDDRSAAEVAAAVKAQGRKAVAIKADMGQEADIERMFKEADALGPLSHFVYNTGIPGSTARRPP